MEPKYDLFVILEGVSHQIKYNDPDGFATKEEAIDFVNTMRKTTYVDGIHTTEGILSYNVPNIKSVYYFAKLRKE
jgi:hypothetical protein